MINAGHGMLQYRMERLRVERNRTLLYLGVRLPHLTVGLSGYTH